MNKSLNSEKNGKNLSINALALQIKKYESLLIAYILAKKLYFSFYFLRNFDWSYSYLQWGRKDGSFVIFFEV